MIDPLRRICIRGNSFYAELSAKILAKLDVDESEASSIRERWKQADLRWCSPKERPQALKGLRDKQFPDGNACQTRWPDELYINR